MVLIELRTEGKETLRQLECCLTFYWHYKKFCGLNKCLGIVYRKSAVAFQAPVWPALAEIWHLRFVTVLRRHTTRTNYTISFTFLHSHYPTLPQEHKHVTTSRHTLTNTYTHIKVIFCWLIVIHCEYGNQMPFPSQFSNVVFLSLPNLSYRFSQGTPATCGHPLLPILLWLLTSLSSISLPP